MDRIPVISPFSKSDLQGKRAFIHARINEFIYKTIGVFDTAQSNDQFFLSIHITQNTSETSRKVYVLNLNQRLVDLLEKADSEDCGFQIIDPEFKVDY